MPAVHSTPAPADQTPDWVWIAAGAGALLFAGGLVYYVLHGGGGEEKPRTPGKKKKRVESSSASCQSVKVEDVGQDEEETDDACLSDLERAMSRKNRGNKFFRAGRYEVAIKCYGEAIDLCPEDKTLDLATFHQNRAAAHEQLNDLSKVLEDCDRALELNGKYVKAMDRRCKALRKLAQDTVKAFDAGDSDAPQMREAIEKLKLALEDVTSCCILEGFQRQDHVLLIDAVLKDLGRSQAKLAVKDRSSGLTSKNFIRQYFLSFSQDPVLNAAKKEENGQDDETVQMFSSPYARALHLLKIEEFEGIIEACTEEIEKDGSAFEMEARALRATFYILTKRQPLAMTELTAVIEDEFRSSPGLRANCLIKRASLYIQQCKDPIKDPEKSFEDFALAEKVDPNNSDVYHHRGQVHLLTDQVNRAIVDFSRAIELNPSFTIARVQKLYTEYRKAGKEKNNHQVSKVIGDFEKALKHSPECVETYALFAQVLSDQGKFDRADELYKQAQKVDPENGNLLVHRGLIALQSQGDIHKAVELIEEGLIRDEMCEFAYETLGTIEVQRGNLSRAVELFDHALPLSNTELEMAHLFGLRDSAVAQQSVSKRLGIEMPNFSDEETNTGQIIDPELMKAMMTQSMAS